MKTREERCAHMRAYYARLKAEQPELIRAKNRAQYLARSPEKKAAYLARARELYQRHRDARQATKRAQRAERRDAVNAQARAYQQNNKDRYYQYNAANRFGVKRTVLLAHLATSQVCEICGDPPAEHKRLAIDHDHETGALRGMLCHTCNLGLGAFKDDPVRLHKAFLYLVQRTKVGDVA